MGARTRLRCAIYTRKSTEEGLEQAFNSLDAQYEACAAYVLSQRAEGWTQVAERYDDGGFSGGSMARPGLTRLLADVAAGRVDVIVVYKVDRLTRSLADFARIVDVLDRRGASFVSVTQAFNTTSSMGRLTLNVLLSFAQFEREVTGERIRDKIAASKQKGMWMGGVVPLGYRVESRKLLVDAADSSTVRHIFTRYVALGCGRLLIDELARDGIRTRSRTYVGGVAWRRGPLFHLLNNRIYLGEIVHKGTSYPGEHDAIIDIALWDRVQQTIAAQRVVRTLDHNLAQRSLLAGLLIDGEGRRMSPSHAVKGARRYRYYVTHAAGITASTTTSASSWRVPAHDLEQAVTGRLGQLLGDAPALLALVGSEAIAAALGHAATLAGQLDDPAERYGLVRTLVSGIALAEDHVAIHVVPQALRTLLGIAEQEHDEPLTLIARLHRIRRARDVRLVVADDQGRAGGQRDDGLIALLAEARTVEALLLAAPGRSIKELARTSNRCRTRFARLLRLAQLAPTIVADILDGTQPATLTPRALLTAELPIGWSEQRVMLGFV